jgi:hypothetical protein
MSKLIISFQDLSCAELNTMLGCNITEMIVEGNTVTIYSEQPLTPGVKVKLLKLLGGSGLKLGQTIEK